MCEPTTIAAIGSYIGSAEGVTVAAGAAEAAEGASVYAAAAEGSSSYLAAAQAAAAGVSAYGSYEQGQTAKKIGGNNAIMAERAAQDAIRRGEEASQEARRKADQLRGLQRARMAANGLDLGVGSAASIVDQTDFFSAVDQATARNNGRQQAWSDRAQGANFTASGDAAAKQANLTAFGTILGGGAQVADKWYARNRAGY